MIYVKTRKDAITQKQMVDGWCHVDKSYPITHPEIPGERIYFDEKDVPASFWKDYTIHYVDSQPVGLRFKNTICVIYPEKVDRSPFVVD